MQTTLQSLRLPPQSLVLLCSSSSSWFISSVLKMLSSLNSHEEEEDEPDHQPHSHQNQPHGFISPSNHVRRLLISCAELIHQGDFAAARRAVSLLSTASSPYGDSTDRLVHQFTGALSLRLSRPALLSSPLPSSSSAPSDAEVVQSSYLSLNQITPFIRFSHLTANQAILEAVDGRGSIHILDFDTMHGVQWPPLMQAIAERSDPNSPPFIRLTGTGTDLDTLRRTGDRLKTFAHTLGLSFQFHPLHLPGITSTSTSLSGADNFTFSSFQLHPGETLVVNCVLFLHKLLKDDNDDAARELRVFLQELKAMNPAVVTIAEREANHNSQMFLRRFMEALEHYTAVFESLEATLPPNSGERLAVEQVWFGREIVDVVAGEGQERKERHQQFNRWDDVMRSVGFVNLPLSAFALSQAKLLLRLHYPSEGYQLQMGKDSVFLGWQNKPLFSVSSWQ